MQHHGKLEKSKLNSTLPRRAKEVKSDSSHSSIAVMNKVRIFCTQDEKCKIRKQLLKLLFFSKFVENK